MRGLLLAAVLVAAAVPAWAQQADHPYFVREQASSTWAGGQITCASTTTVVNAGSTDARALTVCGEAASAYVCFSLTGATPIPCTAALAVMRVTAGMCSPRIQAVRGISISCIRDGGTDGVVNYLLEK